MGDEHEANGGDPFRRAVGFSGYVRTSRLALAAAHAADVALGLAVFVLVAIVADALILATILAVATGLALALPDIARIRLRRPDLAAAPNLVEHVAEAHRMALMLGGMIPVGGLLVLTLHLAAWFWAGETGGALMDWLLGDLLNH